MKEPQKTIRTSPKAHRLLKIVAAISGKMQYEVLETLLQREIDQPTINK